MKLVGRGDIKGGDVKPHEMAGAIYYKHEPMDLISLKGKVHSYKERLGNTKIELDTETGKYNIYEREDEDGHRRNKSNKS